MSSISRSRWRAVAWSPMAAYVLASCRRTRTGMWGMTKVQEGRARIPARAGVSLLPVTAMHREPGRGGEDQHADGVVVQSELINGRKAPCRCSAASAQRPRSIANTASSALPRMVVSTVPTVGGAADISRNSAARPVVLGEEQLRLGAQHDRRHAPRAPRRLFGDCNTGVGRHLLGTGGAHGSPQHGPRRAERRGAAHGYPVEWAAVSRKRPTAGLGRPARSDRHTSGQDSEGGILLDQQGRQVWRATVAQLTAGQPGTSAGPAATSWTHRPARRVLHGVFQGQRRDPWLRTSRAGLLRCSLADDVGLDAGEAHRRNSGQRVVAIPLAPAVSGTRNRLVASRMPKPPRST